MKKKLKFKLRINRIILFVLLIIAFFYWINDNPSLFKTTIDSISNYSSSSSNSHKDYKIIGKNNNPSYSGIRSESNRK